MISITWIKRVGGGFTRKTYARKMILLLGFIPVYYSSVELPNIN